LRYCRRAMTLSQGLSRRNSPPSAGILRRRLRCLVRAPDGRRLSLFVVVSVGGNAREPCWVEYASVEPA
jgi:hypothetical protein